MEVRRSGLWAPGATPNMKKQRTGKNSQTLVATASVGWYCTFTLWTVAYDLIAGSSFGPLRLRTLFKSSADKSLVFRRSQTRHYFFKEHSAWNYEPAVGLGLGLCLAWSRVGHALRPIFISDWSKFDGWVHVENLCLFTDSWRWQRFVSSYYVLTVFLHWNYTVKYICYQESFAIHGWRVYWVFG